MSPRLLIATGFVAVALAVTGGFMLLRDDMGELIGELPTGPDGRPLDERIVQRRRLEDRRAQARNLAPDDRDRAQDPVAAPDDDYGSGTIDRRAAAEGFAYAMGQLDAALEQRKRLEQSEWRELYRQANDAFSALSMHLDASEPGDREELEQAHQRLMSGLRRVRVHGRKFASY